jgi:hypothetical protein
MFSKVIQMAEYDYDGTFRCTYCAKEFLTKDDAEKHYKETHAEEKTHVIE